MNGTLPPISEHFKSNLAQQSVSPSGPPQQFSWTFKSAGTRTVHRIALTSFLKRPIFLEFSFFTFLDCFLDFLFYLAFSFSAFCFFAFCAFLIFCFLLFLLFCFVVVVFNFIFYFFACLFCFGCFLVFVFVVCVFLVVSFCLFVFFVFFVFLVVCFFA